MESSEVQKQLEERREQLGIRDTGDAKSLAEIAREFIPEQLSDEEIARRNAVLDRQKERERDHQRMGRWRELAGQRGVRYSDCRLSNFVTTDPDQEKALHRIREYCEVIRDNVRNGNGVVLFGPRGTGKDHLAMGICRVAIGNDLRVEWRNGMDWFGDVRDNMDGDESESTLIRRMVSPDLLYVSDPLPPIGKLTDFQAFS